jgi:nucleoside triphosphate diphosphatase
VSAAGEELDALLALMRALRDPVHGCPWDREQTFRTIAPFTIEEAYEIADAIEREEPERVRDELGDLLFQVVFHARLAEEQGQFDFAAVARGIREKLVRRHPHVFGALSEGRAIDAAGLHAAWEAHKEQERAAAGRRGTLADVPLALPALSRATKLGRRAGRVGFDWPDSAGVRAKIDEELAEIDAALAETGAPTLAASAGAPSEEVAEELGDLLFTVAQWARRLHVDPEHALRGATLKFERRFERMEQLAAARDWRLSDLSAAEWDMLWNAAKAADPAGQGAGGEGTTGQ